MARYHVGSASRILPDMFATNLVKTCSFPPNEVWAVNDPQSDRD